MEMGVSSAIKEQWAEWGSPAARSLWWEQLGAEQEGLSSPST